MVANTDTKITNNTLLTNNYIIPSLKMDLPVNLLRPIISWTKDDVHKWIEYCMDEYSLQDINLNDFEMNGKALLLLNEDGFQQRAPRSGDILHKALQQHNTLVKSLNYRVFPYQYYGNFGLIPPSPIRHFNIPLPPPPPPPLMSYMHPNFNYMYPCSERRNPTDFINNQQSLRIRHISKPSSSTIERICEKNSIPVSIPSIKGEYADFKDFSIEKHEKVSSQSAEATVSPISQQSNEFKSTKIHPDLQSRIKQEPNDTIHGNGHDTTKKIRYYQDRVDFHGDILMKPPAAKNCRILWEFLYILLEDPSYEAIIHWEDREKMIFRIVQAEKLAALWGLQKNRLSMTYEKLSRGMRYYYSNNIILKEQSKRLLYRFMRSPDEIRKTMKRNNDTTAFYSTINKKSSIPLPSTPNRQNHESPNQISNRFLEIFSVHSPSSTPIMSNLNASDNRLLTIPNNSVSKNHRSSTSSPASFDSNYDSEKQNCSPLQSCSSVKTAKWKHSMAISPNTCLSHGCNFDQPLNLVVHKEESNPFNYKKQRLIYTQSKV